MWTCRKYIQHKNESYFKIKLPEFSLDTSHFQTKFPKFSKFSLIFLNFSTFSLIFQVFPECCKPCNSNLNLPTKFGSSSKSTFLKDILPQDISWMNMKTTSISTRIMKICMMKRSTLLSLWRKVNGQKSKQHNQNFPKKWNPLHNKF